ncbi:hypothetical protein [Bacteroides fragilis]|uniref:hypothetical protein n=1 Tax=Bacteroides fragilis TaxID=817 RepID=UPI00202FD7A3|nr:hypothetical protein [Bacteroides fragilis]MCM0315242.1 hypothetical protein [Bacteroides fragilis]
MNNILRNHLLKDGLARPFGDLPEKGRVYVYAQASLRVHANLLPRTRKFASAYT